MLTAVQEKNVCCLGAGFKGCSLAAVIAFKCPEMTVTVVDEDAEKIEAWNSDNIPVRDPKLKELVEECKNKNLFFSTDIATSIRNSLMIFFCVTVPLKNRGRDKVKEINLQHVEYGARLIADVAWGEKIVVDRSSVALRSHELIAKIIESSSDVKVHVLSNPEFFVGRNCLNDLLFPERVIIGGESSPNDNIAMEKLRTLYERWVPPEKIITGSPWMAQLSKLAVDVFHAQRVSAINAFSAICAATGVDVSLVSKAIEQDPGIGNEDLSGGLGFGDSEYKKSLFNVIRIAETLHFPKAAHYWQRVLKINQFHMASISEYINLRLFNFVTTKKVAIFGFGNEKEFWTSDESPVVQLCESLIEKGAKLHIYDPKVSKKSILNSLLFLGEELIQRSLQVFDNPFEAASKTQIIVLTTDWDEFKNLDYSTIFAQMVKPAYIVDGPRILPHNRLTEMGFQVDTVGRDATKDNTVELSNPNLWTLQLLEDTPLDSTYEPMGFSKNLKQPK